ncbi:MAG: class I SAM-dependent methyltransferase [Candidatus Nanopelagicales bacterium]
MSHAYDLSGVIAPATWCLDLAEVSDHGELTVGAWAVPADGRPVSLRVNGRAFEHEATALARPDLVPVFSLVADASHAGLWCRTPLTDDERDGSRTIKIELVDAETGEPLRAEQAMYVPVSSDEKWPLPDASRMLRVHGDDRSAGFALSGYSTYRKLDDVLRQVTGSGFQGRRQVLDWGCGSGRLLRYLGQVEGVEVTGVDVDGDNVGWCADHLPFARYQTIPLHPPTALPSSAYDVVIGISIFTHLKQDVQTEWLRELRRVATADGLLLITIHGPAVTAMTGDRELWDRVQRDGFADGWNPLFDDVLDEPDYYRNTFQTHEQVRRDWSRFFEIVDIVPACIGNFQDLVVMRPLPE